jgi:cobalamin biosynthesis Co2+ chelatase CbiK
VTSINLQTEFLLQFQKQRKTQPFYWLATDHNKKDKKKIDRQKGKEKLNERRTGKEYEHVGLQEAPHLQDPKQNHFENVKSRNSKKGIFL